MLVGCLIVIGGTLRADEPLVVDPYKVYAATSEALLRCGPDEEYYRTDQLKPGQELEVYVETEDGWLGVRPPDTSFSWIPASQVRLSNDHKTGIVEHKKAVAWVGSNLGTARKYRWQVRLAPGEQVAVISESKSATATGEEETWLKIVPPPGEFRWIHVKDTEKSKEAAERRLFAAQPKVNPEIQVATAVVEAERTAKRTTRPMSAAERAAQRELEAAFGDDEANVATTTSEPNRNDSQSRNDSSVVESEQGVPADNTTTESFDEPIGTGVRNQLRTPKPSEVSLRQQTEIRPLDTGSDNAAGSTSPRDYGIAQASFSASSPAAGRAAPDDPWEQARSAPRRMTAPPIDATELKLANLEKLQLMLAKQMAGGADAATVDQLRVRANLLIETETEPVMRGRLRLFVEQVERYQHAVRGRGDAVPASGLTAGSANTSTQGGSTNHSTSKASSCRSFPLGRKRRPMPYRIAAVARSPMSNRYRD